MGYYLVKSLGPGPYDKGRGLFGEVNARYPNRDHSSDGWIGDPSHAARKSSHNPDWSRGGAVRAVDIDTDGKPWEKTKLRNEVVEAAVGDPRVWYVINNGIIWSRTYGWEARRYSGHPHDGHVHVSVTEEPHKWDDTSRWLEPAARPVKVRLVPVSLPRVRRQFRRALGVERGKVRRINGVARIQRTLNAWGYDAGPVDGIVGRRTLNAWGRWERSRSVRAGRRDRPRIPDRKSLGAMSRRRGFRVSSR